LGQEWEGLVLQFDYYYEEQLHQNEHFCYFFFFYFISDIPELQRGPLKGEVLLVDTCLAESGLQLFLSTSKVKKVHSVLFLLPHLTQKTEK